MRRLCLLLLTTALTACATSPLGHPQLQLFSDTELAKMGTASYQKIKEETPVSHDRSRNRYVSCVAHAITDQVGGNWEVTVFQDDQANAFALPGGKIGVYTGLLDISNSQGQLAAVIGHEVGHVIADHANARLSTQVATNSALQIVSSIAGSGAGGQTAMAALGLGAEVGVLLPFSRSQESEADILGLQLMARAGFDPRESIALWRNMSQHGGGQPPEFLSTHPSHGSRVQNLQDHMPKALQIYQQARAAGRRPDCG